MQTLWCLVVALLVPALVAASAEQPTGEGRKLVIAGSGSGIAIARVLGKQFEKKYPGIKVDVPPSIGSSGAVKAAADGAIALGIITRRLKSEERAQGLTAVPFASTAVVLAVHRSVPDESISTADLVAIYRGKKTTWSNGQKIVVLTREPGDSSTDIIIEGLPAMKEPYRESIEKKFWYVLYSDQIMNQTLVTTRNAIGITDIGEIVAESLPVKPLKLNGIAPNLDTLRDGTYPLVKNLTFVYRPGFLTPDARKFLDFVRSKEGARILRETHYLPR